VKFYFIGYRKVEFKELIKLKGKRKLHEKPGLPYILDVPKNERELIYFFNHSFNYM